MALTTWTVSAMTRIYPQTVARKTKPMTLEVARGERCHFQIALRHTGKGRPVDGNDWPLFVEAAAKTPRGWTGRVRRVGYVPMQHHNANLVRTASDADGLGHTPGYVPDPLFDETELRLPAHETHAFWITAQIPKTAKPGIHNIKVRLTLPKDFPAQEHTVTVRVHKAVLPKRKNFHVINWFYNDALLDFHQCEAFDKRYWEVLPAYFRNMSEHRQDTVYVPVFTPPLDGVKRPSQLLRVKKTDSGQYRFDWREVKKYITLAKKNGLTHFEWTHLFTQWGVKHAIRIYEGQGREKKLLWSPTTPATGKVYRDFLGQFLPRFERFLSEEKLHSRSYFHVSDEPHGDEHLQNYKKARAVLRDLAPWMKVMDALSEIQFAREKLTDMPIPSIKTALDFVAEDIPSWCYYCCGPRGSYLNRLFDTPLAKIRMNGWLFYRWPFQGFLHWGYNYWYKQQSNIPLDPFTVQDGGGWSGWAYGDTSVVYPGADGPIDSIRWEVFAQSLDDYALLQGAGIERAGALLRPLKSFADFPKTEKWITTARKKVFAAIE